MSRTPNSEQLLAIEHEGGVLLKAGAGSGKTFVLVEHLVYLTRKWASSYSAQRGVTLEEHLRSHFSKLVMMTFTKKAAGEMSIRLTERFAELATTEEENKELWQIANDCLPSLMVTTIDGFCRKLITSGLFPHLSTEAKIIFDTERRDQVRELLERWLEKKGKAISSDILEIIVRQKNDLLEAMGQIFNDPGLRLSWKKFSPEETHPNKLGRLLKNSFDLNDLESALLKIHSLELSGEDDRSAFEKFVAQVLATGLPVVDSVDKLLIYSSFYEGKRLNGERTASKKTPASEAALEGLKALREWSQTWSEVVNDYITHYESKILPWIKVCQELFLWMDEHLDPNAGMTFGDIEYHVALGLEKSSDRERIQKTYHYFIVDEFQDTSALQFRIIQLLINNEYQRLFCVGDAKQAIYGFRGGELSVFQDCAEMVPKLRTLANNYRSLPGVINFNNSLFRTLLPLGQDFTGHDPFTVKPEDQNIPQEVPAPESGGIEVIRAPLARNLEEEGKFSNENINKLEATLIAEAIAEDRKNRPQDICTVLYTKLKPSTELIRILMQKKISFTAQFKIDLVEDPIIGIFLALLQRQFDQNSSTHDRYPLFILKSYLKVLGLEREIGVEELQEFDSNIRYWGLLEAFRKFIFAVQITNENSDLNLGVIETIAEIYHQDPEAILVQLKQGDNQRVSLELRSGEACHMVQIMSAHASKGLEFDIVYLGGIYTNGREQNDGAMFGNIPGSFEWFKNLSTREKQKSPFYVYENELSKYKDFSESKRLFYVACTRAKKKLSWIHMDLPEKSFSIPKNSWIDGLNVWVDRELHQHSEYVVIKNVSGFDSTAVLKASSTPQLPLFFHDSMGIYSKGEGRSELAIAAELSVTRLNSLIDCPRKFYLENILKLNVMKNAATFIADDEELASVISSSAARGTQIHELIAEGIGKNYIVPRRAMSTELEAPTKWALQEVALCRYGYELLAETPLKFKFFDFMISGIPDLFMLPLEADKRAQIWDFKTGRITQDKLAHYWIQLKIYAYALYVLGRVPLTNSIETKLCFVDEEKILTLSFSWEEIRPELYQLWRSQNEPWKINPDHCTQCSYGDICPR